MAAFSVIYVSLAVLLYRMEMGDAALVYANILNLSARIIYALQFIASFFRQHNHSLSWSTLSPSLSLVCACIVSAVLIRMHQSSSAINAMVQERTDILKIPALLHLSLGATFGLVCAGTWWLSSGRHTMKIKRD
jgi:oligosaccharide translocation protein RFT1